MNRKKDGLGSLDHGFRLVSDKAIDLVDEAHDIVPDNGSITDTLDRILIGNGEPERAIERSPGTPLVQFQLASALAKNGETTATKDIVSKLPSSEARFSSRARVDQLARSLSQNAVCA